MGQNQQKIVSTQKFSPETVLGFIEEILKYFLRIGINLQTLCNFCSLLYKLRDGVRRICVDAYQQIS